MPPNRHCRVEIILENETWFDTESTPFDHISITAKYFVGI